MTMTLTSEPVAATRTSPVVVLDAGGAFPAVAIDSSDRAVWLNSSVDPIGDAERWLRVVLSDERPPIVVLIGLGLGYALDALERVSPRTRVLAFEPFEDVLPHFYNRRDWSAWLETGRLQIVSGQGYQGGAKAWSALDPKTVPPVIVNRALASAFSATVAGCRIALDRARRGSPLDPEDNSIRQSMLHPTVLSTLEHFASTINGVIVEIGAYVGGATIAMARGVRDSGRSTPLVTMEPGGSHHAKHPRLPSLDITRDLRHNLRIRRLERYVTVYDGRSSDAAGLQLVNEILAERQATIGLLCIDADGRVQRDFDLYLPLCGNGCLIAVDDYVSTEAAEKAAPTQAAVDRLVAEGRATELGVFGYGTWMGIYRG